jgi:hypothetical protein
MLELICAVFVFVLSKTTNVQLKQEIGDKPSWVLYR